jgi:cell wall-associated NlpC family hydrolase
VVDFATKFLGDPYVWGGTRPGGFDCSGLLQYVLAKAGKINLPRISAQQARFGNRVGYKELRAGDLVAWDNSSRNNGADHIALYIGNGWIIEAPRAGLNVRKRFIGRDLDGGWGVHIRYTGDTAGSTRRPV